MDTPQNSLAEFGKLETFLSLLAGCALIGLFITALIYRQEQAVVDIEPIEPIAVFPDFASIKDVNVKKQMFFDFLQLYIYEQNRSVTATRQRVLDMSDIVSDGVPLSVDERDDLLGIALRYDLEPQDMRESQIIFELLKRVDMIPASLALAQAANESGWGTSRFALEANNIFGHWCFDEGCGVVPNRRASDASHEVRSFASVDAAVRAYFMNLNTHDAYKGFRDMRYQMRNQRGELDPLVLAYGLIGYSARGDSYVDEVQTIIQQNDLVNRYKI